MNIEEKYKFGGWENCIRMTDGDIELVATTDVGPRIIRLGFIGGQNIFREVENDYGRTGGDAWRMYGGHRLWHGPEANPRCYFPDNQPVDYKVENNTLKLSQRVEAATGMQKQMDVTLTGDNSVKVVHRIINHNIWDISFAVWSITVMGLNGRAIIPQEPFQSWEDKLTPVRPLVLWGYTDMSDPRWIWGKKYIQLRQDPAASARQKLGLLNTPGWAAYILNGEVFIKSYDFDPSAAYIDFGVNTEIYTDADILEIESLGAYNSVHPDDYMEHTERWRLFRAEAGSDESSIDKNVLPLVTT
jgi:hypothetical protein